MKTSFFVRKCINLLFVYLPVVLILSIIFFVYFTYVFTYISYLIPQETAANRVKYYPFFHTSTPQSRRVRGIILLSIVTFFFALCTVSFARVVLTDPGYIPDPIHFEFKVVQKGFNSAQPPEMNYFIRKFDKIIEENPLTFSDYSELLLNMNSPVSRYETGGQDNCEVSLEVRNNKNSANNTLSAPADQADTADKADQGDTADQADPFAKYKNMNIKKIILCGSCIRLKAERSHHCRQCNKCVLKMDHHCPWLATCIGFRNYKYFLLLQWHGIIATLVVSGSFVEGIVGFVMDEDTSIWMIILSLNGWLCGAGLLAFWWWWFLVNWRLMFKGETVIEHSEKIRFPNANIVNIYDLGKYRNFVSVFGRNPVLWLLPFAPNYEGEGVEFRTNLRRN